MKTLTLAAAFTLAAATAASACNWSKDAVAYSTPAETTHMSQKVEMAKAPVDAWLIRYLDQKELG